MFTQEKGVIGAKEISKRVRDYFLETHGQFAVFGFLIENVQYNKKNKVWIVKCSFSSTPVISRIYYEVTIDSRGYIKDVTKIKGLKPSP